MPENRQNLRDLPSVGQMLDRPPLVALAEQYGRPLATWALRRAIQRARSAVLAGQPTPDEPAILADVQRLVRTVAESSLQPVVNASGVVLHTNLGRAPLGRETLEQIADVARGYCNLEFDLDTARRGRRDAHLAELLTFLTSAEDAIVVNNNAAGIVLTLNTLAAGREVVISRGELIEIGGSFRIPEIMHASGVKVVEVGTTNRTRAADYQAALGPETALILKAHKSNYAIRGFTEEASLGELARLARSAGLPLAYDIGSGLLRKPAGLPLDDEPDVGGAIRAGADLVMFSGDKLLGGPQAGIVAGRAELVRRLAKAPLMRALRVGKLTLAALGAACRHYLRDDLLLSENPTFALLQRPVEQRRQLAAELLAAVERAGGRARRVETIGHCGGGTLPEVELPSAAVELLPPKPPEPGPASFAERVFHRLLGGRPPVLGILREGRLLLDVLALFPDDVATVAAAVSAALARDDSSGHRDGGNAEGGDLDDGVRQAVEGEPPR